MTRVLTLALSPARRSRIIAAAVISLASSVLIAAPALGATVSVQGDTLTMTAAPGEGNCITITVTRSGGGQDAYAISDCFNYPVMNNSPGPCWEESGVLMCAATGIALKRIESGDGDDRVIVDDHAGSRSEVIAGTGDDVVTTGSGNDLLDGGDGKDQLNGSDGDDRMYGGVGDDKFTSYRGADLYDGGPGNDDLGQSTEMEASEPDVYAGGEGADSFSYGSRSADVTVSLDGAANDGEAGESDNVGADVEILYGGPGSDTIAGSAAGEAIYGGGGNDTIDGGAGDDLIDGGINDDRLNGGAGNDTVRGAHHSDVVAGGAGRDQLEGDLESIYAEGADDVILARDGEADSIRCGLGTDRAEVDSVDALPGDSVNRCESVQTGENVQTGAPPTTPPDDQSPSAPDAGGSGEAAKLAASRLVLRRNVIKAPVRCTAATRCTGKVQLWARGLSKRASASRSAKLATRRVSIAPGKTAKVKFKLKKSSRRNARRARRIGVVVRMNGELYLKTVKLVKKRR